MIRGLRIRTPPAAPHRPARSLDAPRASASEIRPLQPPHLALEETPVALRSLRRHPPSRNVRPFPLTAATRESPMTEAPSSLSRIPINRFRPTRQRAVVQPMAATDQKDQAKWIRNRGIRSN